MLAPVLPNEADRLVALYSLGILDTPSEPQFDDLTQLAANICGTPIALVSLVDSCRQWFKSRVGLDATETHRDIAFCTHAIAQNNLMIVEDAAADVRFADNPLVTGAPHIRFYAGMPLTTPDGHNLGTLCVIDRVPRTLAAHQQDAVRILARQVVAQLILRQQLLTTEFELQEHETFRVLFEQSSDAHLIFDERDGIIDCNQATVAMLRCRDKSEVLNLHPAVLSPEFQPDGRRSLEKCVEMDATARRNGSHRFDWTHRRMTGEEFPCEVTLTPIELHGRSVLLVVWHDLTDRMKAQMALRSSEEQLRAFLNNSPALVFVKDELSRFVFLSDSFVNRLKIVRENWLGKTDFDVWPRDVAQPFYDHDMTIRTGGVPVRLTETTPEPDGSITHWHVNKFPFLTAEGKQFLAGFALDVTAEKKIEIALRDSEVKFRSTVDRLAEGVFVVDPATHQFVEANSAILNMLGYTLAEFLALNPFDLAAGETPEMFARNIEAMQEQLSAQGRCDVGRRQFRRKDGSVVPVDLRVTAVPTTGAGLHAVIVRDLTAQLEHENQMFEYQSELELANAKLSALATTDGMTGVKNRKAFDEKLEEEFDRATRYHHPLSLIVLDVDHFKPFNDSFGHPAGDSVLKSVAAILQKTSRTADFVARYGGEEFVVILPDTEFAGAMVLAERLRRAVAGMPCAERAITVSLGVATLTKVTTDAAALFKEADNALYRAKQSGRNRVCHRSGAVSKLQTVRV